MTATQTPAPVDAGPAIHMEHRRLSWRPVNPLALLPEEGAAFAWADPGASVVMVAAGAATSVEAAGLEDAAAAVRDESRRIVSDAGSPAARWVGGFGFAGAGDGPWSGFPGAWFFVPEVLLTIRGDEVRLSAASGTARDAGALLDGAENRLRSARPQRPAGEARSAVDGPPAADRVKAALAAIAAGRVEKVVVSTRRTLQMDSGIGAADALVAVAAREPTAFHYLVRRPSGPAWVGASPERLVAVSGDEVRTMALAGTVRRGATASEDASMAKALIASPKERAEHALVVSDIAARLDGCEAQMPSAPEVRRLEGMFHLQTTIAGRRPDGDGVLDFAARLHPTAALGGSPREAALELLREIEPEGRGWYGGAVGWVDVSGQGDLTVAIRGALIDGGTITGFAGAGVVDGSEPEAEAAEVALKLAAVLGAFESLPA